MGIAVPAPRIEHITAHCQLYEPLRRFELYPRPLCPCDRASHPYHVKHCIAAHLSTSCGPVLCMHFQSDSAVRSCAHAHVTCGVHMSTCAWKAATDAQSNSHGVRPRRRERHNFSSAGQRAPRSTKRLRSGHLRLLISEDFPAKGTPSNGEDSKSVSLPNPDGLALRRGKGTHEVPQLLRTCVHKSRFRQESGRLRADSRPPSVDCRQPGADPKQPGADSAPPGAD